MDGLCELLRNTDRPGIIYNEKIDGFKTFEIYAQEGLAKLRNRRISDHDVVSWLNRSDVIHGSKCDIVRMILVRRQANSTCQPWESEISKKNIDLILEYFDLKKSNQLIADGSIIYLPLEDRHGSNKQHSILALFGHTGVLTWTYDLMTARTDVLWYGNDPLFPFSVVGPVLESQKNLARHPMFMALVAALCISQATQSMIEPICEKINQVENRTQHSPANLLRGNIAEGNYAALSAMMSGCATRLAAFKGRMQNLDDIFQSISDYRWPQRIQRPGWAETVDNELDECVSILKQLKKGQEQRICYLSQRADIQLTALFNLITQQETRLSISVAEDSRTLALATKDDSTAMKTLAAVTVFFLPGTFVAAFFSMPLFHWDAQTGELTTVVSRRFWVYWVVTGPLTLATLILWVVWMRMQTRRHRARNDAGREIFNHEIYSPQRDFR